MLVFPGGNEIDRSKENRMSLVVVATMTPQPGKLQQLTDADEAGLNGPTAGDGLGLARFLSHWSLRATPAERPVH